MAHTFYPSTQEAETDRSEFEASLIYNENSRASQGYYTHTGKLETGGPLGLSAKMVSSGLNERVCWKRRRKRGGGRWS